MGLYQDTIGILKNLISFDTVSRNSNLPIIEWVEEYLVKFGAKTTRIASDDGNKCNLIAVFGPDVEGGIVFSGHSDVVPVDGQDWATDPFELTEAEGKLYGRGTCDMKAFSACFLACVPMIAKTKLARPIYYALSYDEEVGCLGAPRMVEYISRHYPKINAVIVGEPTDMKVVSGHKGIASFVVEITGLEAHSSRTDRGVSAIMEAIPLMSLIKELGEKYKNPDGLFTPSGTSMTIGIVEGGTAVNILARHCKFVFDIRYEPDFDLDGLINIIKNAVKGVDESIKSRAPEGGAILKARSRTPALRIVPDSNAETLARAISGDNEIIAVSYAAEAGLFQGQDMPTIICGPGSILQAHQPNEFVETQQIEKCLKFLEQIIKTQI